jgi:glyoxalase family protein
MAYPLLGLHHVTATVDQAQADLDFCADTLGLRLIKKTVNFDNHHVYHFYYGNETGTPGTIWTTFPYHGRGVRMGTKGAGQVTLTSFSVPGQSLPYWTTRLREHGITVEDATPRFGESSVIAVDPSGLVIGLVATDRDTRAAWTVEGIPPEAAVRGLHSVSMTVSDPRETIGFMRELLGFTTVNEMNGRVRLGVNGDVPGHTIDVLHDTSAPPAMNGLGTVHHVAFAIAEPDEQRRLREELLRRGVKVTDVMDRQYFQSIYFREPGGVLFEVATVSPGFTVDEPAACLGEDLKLPPWEEPNRPDIERALPTLVERHRRLR